MANGAIGLPGSVLRALSQLRTIMAGGTAATAEERYRHLLGAFRATEPAEINALPAVPEQLSLASDYVHAVVDDLDEWRPVAATELHGVLGTAVGPILVGWPE